MDNSTSLPVYALGLLGTACAFAACTVSLTPLPTGDVVVFDASPEGAVDDPGIDAGTDTGVDAAPDGSAELVEGTFGGVQMSVDHLILSRIDTDIAGNDYYDLEASAASGTSFTLLLNFAPKVGTTACPTALITYGPPGKYQFSDSLDTKRTKDCTLTVTRFDGVGGWVDGTFSGTVEPVNGGDTMPLTGSFHVIHRKAL